MSCVTSDVSGRAVAQTRPESSGTRFFITEDGYLITNEHVAGAGAQVRLVTESGIISARVVKVDAANDLALLKAEGKFGALPVISSCGVRLGATVATLGFPNVGLQGFAPKLAKGKIAGLADGGASARDRGGEDTLYCTQIREKLNGLDVYHRATGTALRNLGEAIGASGCPCAAMFTGQPLPRI